MINTLSSSTDRFLADISNLSNRLIKAQRQVSSGLRMQTVSDDADQVPALLELKAHIAHNNQLKYQSWPRSDGGKRRGGSHQHRNEPHGSSSPDRGSECD